MRMTRGAWAVLGAATLFVVSVGMTQAAPAPAPGQAKPAEKWEYGELYASSRIFRGGEDELPGRGGRGGRGGFPGGGGAPGGGAAAAQPVPAAQPALPRLTIRWVTGDGEVVASGWEELAAKLKAPAAKPGGAT